MKLSIIVPVLNSHEIVRRNNLWYGRMNLPTSVEVLFIDDGSDPPIESPYVAHRTHDKREWTWALARNAGARIAKGSYLLMTDLDYIITKDAINDALDFTGDYMGFKRQLGVLDENGKFTQDRDTLISYGLPEERYDKKGCDLPPHPNNFVIRKDLFFDMGMYREDRIGKPYPQREDGAFKRTRHEWVRDGKLVESEYRPMLYMFPNGRWCGDVDYNPFDLFHNLSRKSGHNPWQLSA